MINVSFDHVGNELAGNRVSIDEGLVLSANNHPSGSGDAQRLTEARSDFVNCPAQA
jgi:hypothetical protein